MIHHACWSEWRGARPLSASLSKQALSNYCGRYCMRSYPDSRTANHLEWLAGYFGVACPKACALKAVSCPRLAVK